VRRGDAVLRSPTRANQDVVGVALRVVPLVSGATRRAPRREIRAAARNPVGRPRAGDSTATRRRVLRAARNCFGRLGYDTTTIREVASEANLTPGALYHHFPSKQELFAATFREVQEIVLIGFEEAAMQGETLAAKSVAILEQAVKLHAEDPTLAVFAAVAPIELQRHQELRQMLGSDFWEFPGFLDGMVRAHESELADDVDAGMGSALLVATALGLAQLAALSGSVDVHRAGVQGFERLLAGRLFGTAAGSPAGQGRSLRDRRDGPQR
jgi:AcrR family transcriptional regulator